MDIHNLLKLNRKLKDNGTILSFTGFLSQGIIQEIGDILRASLLDENYISPEGFDIFSIFIEQTQNIKNYVSKHGDSKDTEFLNSGIVSIKKDDEKYYISASNLVHNKDVSYIEERLNFIISKNYDEIEQLYTKQLKVKRDDTESNAGLGFLEMALKATQPIKFSFIKKNEQYSSFVITAII